MTLDSLHLLFFKNYDEASLSLSSHINCFIGENGSGKTNLLDAIHYLALTKSAFAASDAQCIKQGADFFVVRGNFTLPDASTDLVQCSLRLGQKKVITRNKQPYERISDHIGQYPVVLISPYDTDLIRQGSEERRKYFDSLISQLDHAYLELLIQYTALLKQRNALLKHFAERHSFDRDYLQVVDEQLAPLGTELVQKRQAFLEAFTPIFCRHYLELAESKEAVSLDYKSPLLGEDFAALLRLHERKDLALQRTSVGAHKDDYLFLMDGMSVKHYGSQGQQKSYAIALKLAQFEIMATTKQHKPLLLLDDIFDRLDERRIGRLLQLVANHTFGQVFLTDTHLERTDRALAGLSEDIARFRVENGRVTPL